MEEAVIRAGSDLGLTLHRREDVQTGVWHGDEKVCAIGVRLLRARVTIHGFALNCDPDLSWFDGIVACGLPGHGVTSLSRLAGRAIEAAEVAPSLERHLADVFGLDLVQAPEAIASELRPVAV
jgi:lipoyl(octanoyl) transferase